MTSPGYFSIEMKCFEISGLFLKLRAQKLESLFFGFKVLTIIFTILCHSVYVYFNMGNVAAMGKGIVMSVTLMIQLIYLFILIVKRDQLLRIKTGIEDLTIRYSETNEKSLQRFVVFERRIVKTCVTGVLLLVASYLVPLTNTLFVAASGYGFHFQFPPQVAIPFEISSLPVYFISYAVICIGTYAVVLFGVSFYLLPFSKHLSGN